ncbi:PGF-CTERM sorting domain-containing protein [Haloarchaeobius sp. DYHT-AS-18]|uniref:PGF-CTERM sorting domain-containing protein n=1 Tax=Haloarchaeobius sp. DYHT-AS-18 TaxID=3446117 RepID=UPI003EB93AD9
MNRPRTLLVAALLVLGTPAAVTSSIAQPPASSFERSDEMTTVHENDTPTASNVTILGTSLERESLDSYRAIQVARENGTLAPDTVVSPNDTIVIRFDAPGLRSTLDSYNGSNLTTRFHRFVNETAARFAAFHSNPVQRLYRGENVPTSSGEVDRIILSDPTATTLVPGPENETYYHVVNLTTVAVDEGLPGYNSPGIDCGDKWVGELSLGPSANGSNIYFGTLCHPFAGEILVHNRSSATLLGSVEGVTPGESVQVRLRNASAQTIVTLLWREVATELARDPYEYLGDDFSMPLDLSSFEPNETVTADVAIVQRDGTAIPVEDEKHERLGTFVVPAEPGSASPTTTPPPTTTTTSQSTTAETSTPTERVPTTAAPSPTTTTTSKSTTTETPTPTEQAPTTTRPVTTDSEPHTDEIPGFTLLGALVALTCLALLGRRR